MWDNGPFTHPGDVFALTVFSIAQDDSEGEVEQRKRVVLLMEASRAYGRNCLQGIASYVRSTRTWNVLHMERETGDALPPCIAAWEPDGVITRIEDSRLASKIDELNVPVVDLGGAFLPKQGASFDTDQVSCAEFAVEHFLERGFHNFAFCGYSGIGFSDDRCKYFKDLMNSLGNQVNIFPGSSSNRWRPRNSAAPQAGDFHEERISIWIRTLPKPVAIFACNDERGRQVLEACWRLGLSVPEDVAVLGVDNDELLCNLSVTPLSSIVPDTTQIGMRGAEALDALMAGEHVPRKATLVPPIGIEARQSSEVMAIDDPDMIDVLKFIQEHACQGMTVNDVAEEVAMSRTSLDRRFHRALGRSPKSEIDRIRFNKAKQLLDETDFKLEHIAHLVGYSSASQFATGFKRYTGLTTQEYRARAMCSAV